MSSADQAQIWIAAVTVHDGLAGGLDLRKADMVAG